MLPPLFPKRAIARRSRSVHRGCTLQHIGNAPFRVHLFAGESRRCLRLGAHASACRNMPTKAGAPSASAPSGALSVHWERTLQCASFISCRRKPVLPAAGSARFSVHLFAGSSRRSQCQRCQFTVSLSRCRYAAPARFCPSSAGKVAIL